MLKNILCIVSMLTCFMVGCDLEDPNTADSTEEQALLQSVEANVLTASATMTLYPPTDVDWRQTIVPGEVLTFDIPLPTTVKTKTVTDFTFEFTVQKDGYSTYRLGAPYQWSVSYVDFMYSGSYVVTADELYGSAARKSTGLFFINNWDEIPVRFNIYSQMSGSYAELTALKVIITYQ